MTSVVTEPRGQFVTVGGQLVIVPVVVVTTVDVVHDVLPEVEEATPEPDDVELITDDPEDVDVVELVDATDPEAVEVGLEELLLELLLDAAVEDDELLHELLLDDATHELLDEVLKVLDELLLIAAVDEVLLVGAADEVLEVLDELLLVFAVDEVLLVGAADEVLLDELLDDAAAGELVLEEVLLDDDDAAHELLDELLLVAALVLHVAWVANLARSGISGLILYASYKPTSPTIQLANSRERTG